MGFLIGIIVLTALAFCILYWIADLRREIAEKFRYKAKCYACLKVFYHQRLNGSNELPQPSTPLYCPLCGKPLWVKNEQFQTLTQVPRI